MLTELNQQRCENGTKDRSAGPCSGRFHHCVAFPSHGNKQVTRTVPTCSFCSLCRQKSPAAGMLIPTLPPWCCTLCRYSLLQRERERGRVCSHTHRRERARLVFRCPVGRGMTRLHTSPTARTIGAQIYNISNN